MVRRRCQKHHTSRQMESRFPPVLHTAPSSKYSHPHPDNSTWRQPEESQSAGKKGVFQSFKGSGYILGMHAEGMEIEDFRTGEDGSIEILWAEAGSGRGVLEILQRKKTAALDSIWKPPLFWNQVLPKLTPLLPCPAAKAEFSHLRAGRC